MTSRPLALLGLTLLTAPAACGGHSTLSKGSPALVAADIGAGLAVVAGATGPLSRDLAARSTSVPAATLDGFLGSHGFQSGYARVWQRGEEFISAATYHFYADRDAAAFVQLPRSALAASAAVRASVDPALPDAAAFVLTASVSGRTRFCASEWFASRRNASVVTRCAGFPLSVDQVAAAAHRQHDVLEQLP